MTALPPRLLVVDDEPDLRTLYELTLVREGYDVDVAANVGDAWSLLCQRSYSAVITDMRLPDGTGLDLLRRMEADARAERAIVITAYGSAENAVDALKAGAFDYLTKPVDLRQFRQVVASAMGRTPTPAPARGPLGTTGSQRPMGIARRTGSPTPHPAAPGTHPALAGLIGTSNAIHQVRVLVEKVARGMAPVLLLGESGTGKELAARAIHASSSRAGQAFIAVNCGAIPEQLLEAEFFGYRKGAFTGAQEDRQGFFQAAQDGTLFLDEIGELPLAMQSKLLRVIQERAVRPVGGVAELPLNVRILSATHRELAQEVQAGRFRQDLFYRLNVIQIRLPALRERVGDLGAISDTLLSRIARDAGVAPAPRLSHDALARLAQYGFPGNVRELENLLHRAVALSATDLIEYDDLGLDSEAVMDSEWSGLSTALVRADASAHAVPSAAKVADVEPSDLVAYLDGVERDVLLRSLESHRFNRTAAGHSLGLSLRQMRYRMARLGIQAGDTPADRQDAGD